MLKKLIIGLIGLIVALLLIGFVLPGNMDLSDSITIDAPPDYVFEEINDLEKNPNWSYWNHIFPNMKPTYSEIKSGVGAMSSWDDADAGKGTMIITESIPYSSVKVDLDFMEQGTAKAWYTLEPNGEGTKLSTGFITDLGMNPVMRWMGNALMKPEMKKSFDYNLSRLKEIAEAKPKFSIKITEENVQPVSYIGISSIMSYEDMTAVNAQMGKSFGELAGVLQKAKVQPAGSAFCLYPQWDEDSKQMEMVCAMPVSNDAKIPSKYPVKQTEGGTALKAVHSGDYKGLEDVHNQLNQYIAFKNLQINGAPWEVYVTDPQTEPDTSKWVTEVYYPIKK